MIEHFKKKSSVPHQHRISDIYHVNKAKRATCPLLHTHPDILHTHHSHPLKETKCYQLTSLDINRHVTLNARKSLPK